MCDVCLKKKKGTTTPIRTIGNVQGKVVAFVLLLSVKGEMYHYTVSETKRRLQFVWLVKYVW